jgi:RNA polymerase sigma-70 factor, ECF subfamily
MNDRTTRRADAPVGPTGTPTGPGGHTGGHGPATRVVPGHGVRRPAAPPSSEDTELAVEIRGLLERGSVDEARDRFADLVARHQRRALRIAYQYLRDSADADEAVQDAFVKVFAHIGSYREAWPFEVWFTRILINGCLDRRKALARRERWFVATEPSNADEVRVGSGAAAAGQDPERALLARERRSKVAAAVDRLDGRQRMVFMLCHFGDCTPREVSIMTGLKESTVRVHLFRAARRLRALLGGKL